MTPTSFNAPEDEPPPGDRPRTDPDAVLDVRPPEAFEREHRAGAVNIPLEELTDRIHELPPPEVPLAIYDECSIRARWARSRLRARGRESLTVSWRTGRPTAGPTERGPSRRRLWRPHDWLIEAVTAARETWPTLKGRRALDLACGAGRDAVFLAECGFETEAWDILPDALARCRALANRNGVDVLTRRRDIEADPEIEADRYDLICVFNFLHRPLMSLIAAAVRPGGLVAYETFVHPQRELFGRPRSDKYLLRPGELPEWFAGWRVLASREGLVRPRRYVASLLARKP